VQDLIRGSDKTHRVLSCCRQWSGTGHVVRSTETGHPALIGASSQTEAEDQLCWPPARQSGWTPTWGKSTFWKRAGQQGFAPRWLGGSPISRGVRCP
jgi:hypothetical protein